MLGFLPKLTLLFVIIKHEFQSFLHIQILNRYATIRPVDSFFTRGGSFFTKQTPGAPQVHAGPYFLNRLKGAPHVYTGVLFSKQTPWGATSSHGLYNCEKHSHMSKSKLMSDKRSQMLRSSVIIPRNYTSLCAE